MTDQIPANNQESKKAGYDTHEANIKFIITLAVICIIILAISIVIVDQIFTISREKLIHDIVLAPESIALRELRSREDEALNSYAVIDTVKGIYRIPIDRAMTLVVNETYQKQMEIPRGTKVKNK
jgi:hypothetical protein